KKLVAVLFGLLMIGMTFSVGGASAEETLTVILVSDNSADSAIAQYLANLTGAVIVTTTWGTYDPNVTAEILGYAPDQVIIVGGPCAVVDEYITDLEEYNITVYRWWGANRYETNLAVMGNASKLLGIKFNSTVVVAGNDSLAIQTAFKLALKNRALILYVNHSTNVTTLIKRFKVNNTVVVRGRASEKVMENLAKGLEKCNCTVKEVRANVTREHVERILEQVRERLLKVEEIANMTNSTELMERVEELSQLIEEANQSLQSGDYTKAYQLALKLQVLSEFTLRDARLELINALKLSGRLSLELELKKLQLQLSILEEAGVDVSAVREILDKAGEALKAGNYSVARVLLRDARKALRELYVKNRGAIRVHVGVHFPPGQPGRGRRG
ncbi:cell wall-binding repeat-containing protein, partial [Thermococcus sp.]